MSSERSWRHNHILHKHQMKAWSDKCSLNFSFRRNKAMKDKSGEKIVKPGKIRQRTPVLERHWKFNVRIVDDILSYFFYYLGWCIGAYPWVFIILMIGVTIGLGSGIKQLEKPNDNIQYLFTPRNGKAASDGRMLENVFRPVMDYRWESSACSVVEQFLFLLWHRKNPIRK